MTEQLSAIAPKKTASGPTFDGPRRRVIVDDETASEAVISAVENAKNVEPTSLPPLENTVDTDGLDDLVGQGTESPAAGLVFTRSADITTELEVSFQYAGFDVTVTESFVVLE